MEMNKMDSKIAVIGGGLSGLVIAYKLQKKGYKRVTVFESENRVGGKLHTIWYRGKSFEIGAVFGLSSQKNLKALMKELNIKIDGPRISRVNCDVNGNKTMQIPKEKLGNFVRELKRLPGVLGEYKSLETINIHNIEAPLMLPFSDWCDINDFKVLKSVYGHHFTSYGLGDIYTVPAVYVLRMLSYENLMSFMDLPEFFTWKEGTSCIIQPLSSKITDIRLGQGIGEISLTGENKVCVHTDFEKLEFDSAIIATPLSSIPNIYGIDGEERELIDSIKYQSFNVYVFTADKVPRGSGCVLENLSVKRRGHIIIWNSRWDDEELITVYTYDDPKKSKIEALQIIREDLLKLGVENPRLYQYKNWKHCPYVDTDTLKKEFYDRIEELQGKNNIYLAGEIMSTATMENTIRYSTYMVNKYF